MSKYPPGHHLSPEACRARGWAKGVSGNPKGKPPVIREVRELAQAYTVDAIESLRDIMVDQKANGSARVQAAVALLDRGWGRPKQSVEVQVDHDATGLAAALSALNDRLGLNPPAEDGEIIDVTVTETVKRDSE